MKVRKNLFLQLAAATALGFAPSLHAAALIWAGGPGTWQIGDAGQWGVAWTDGDTATFNGPGGAVTLGGAVTTGNAALVFSGGNYSISAGAPLAIALDRDQAPNSHLRSKECASYPVSVPYTYLRSLLYQCQFA